MRYVICLGVFVLMAALAAPARPQSSPNNARTTTPQADGTWLERLDTDPVASFTGLLCLVTAGLIYVGVRQDQTTRSIQRAFVLVKKPQSIVGVDPAGMLQSMGFWVVLENSGTTPAGTISATVNVTWVEDIQEFAFGKTGDDTSTEKIVTQQLPFVLGPKAEVGAAPIANQLLGEFIVNAWEGKSHIFLWGKCEYTDIFKAAHCTEYCYKVKIVGNLNVVRGDCQVSFEHYGDHNRHYDK